MQTQSSNAGSSRVARVTPVAAIAPVAAVLLAAAVASPALADMTVHGSFVETHNVMTDSFASQQFLPVPVVGAWNNNADGLDFQTWWNYETPGSSFIGAKGQGNYLRSNMTGTVQNSTRFSVTEEWTFDGRAGYQGGNFGAYIGGMTTVLLRAVDLDTGAVGTEFLRLDWTHADMAMGTEFVEGSVTVAAGSYEVVVIATSTFWDAPPDGGSWGYAATRATLSGSAAVPAPGVLAMLLGGGAIVGRRRRR